MQERPTVEDIKETIQTRDMRLWGYDLMLDFINATNFDTLPEIDDLLAGERMMTRYEKERLIEIADRRVDAILAELE